MKYLFLSFGLWFLTPFLTSAHEVYVLPPEVAKAAIATPGFSLVQVALNNLGSFLFWGLITATVIVLVFFISISKTAEKALDPFLAKLPPYAPFITRVTLGLALLAAAYNHALFGPELPLVDIFGSATPYIIATLIITSLMVIVGWFTRLAAIILVGIFLFEIMSQGWYMLTYANYFGELILLIILGAHQFAVHPKEQDQQKASWLIKLKAQLAPLAFPILRVSFGLSLLYASLYAKVIHNQLVLEVSKEYPDLVAFFGFEPHFLILGAAIIEIIIGLFFILGIEIRFTSLFVLFWLSLSLWYFGEVVWPHIILIGIPTAFIFYGYDKYSLEGYFYKRDGREPVL